MGSTRRGAHRVAATAAALLTAATGLGLVATPRAEASCAGPQLALEQDGVVLPQRRVGEGDGERILYDVARDRPLTSVGSNLTLDCQDTYSATAGCGGPTPDPPRPIRPLQDPTLVLTQGRHRWTLAEHVTVQPDLTSRTELEIPAAARAGAATLTLASRVDGGNQLDLVLR